MTHGRADVKLSCHETTDFMALLHFPTTKRIVRNFRRNEMMKHRGFMGIKIVDQFSMRDQMYACHLNSFMDLCRFLTPSCSILKHQLEIILGFNERSC
jgi:hypothetical protein